MTALYMSAGTHKPPSQHETEAAIEPATDSESDNEPDDTGSAASEGFVHVEYRYVDFAANQDEAS